MWFFNLLSLSYRRIWSICEGSWKARSDQGNRTNGQLFFSFSSQSFVVSSLCVQVYNFMLLLFSAAYITAALFLTAHLQTKGLILADCCSILILFLFLFLKQTFMPQLRSLIYLFTQTCAFVFCTVSASSPTSSSTTVERQRARKRRIGQATSRSSTSLSASHLPECAWPLQPRSSPHRSRGSRWYPQMEASLTRSLRRYPMWP